ncbi:MAG: hypothetical protein KKD73_13130 [Proteobacteria bacterium]|nr:hypothetical protein [Pseudomonadota bacterium]MBU1639179.1 hypothetical protein [Pseudomonadota bacterium]
MKKILSTVAALGLVAGMATAAQALEFSVSGYYFVEGAHLSSGDGNGVVTTVEDSGLSGLTDGVTTDKEVGNDDYYMHEFVIRPVMKVNDKVVMKAKVYLATDKFGDDATGSAFGNDGDSINFHHLFMEYTSPIGMLRVGRTSAGLWQGDFLSSDANANRIMYFPNFLPKPLGACVFIQKSAENDSAAGNSSVDEDSDLYEASAWYKTKDLVAALAYDYYDFNQTTTADSSRHRIKGYYNQNFSNIYAEMEFSYDWGTIDSDTVGVADQDVDTFALMADVGMTISKLDVGMLFFYASGDDDNTDTDRESAMGYVYTTGLGEQFQPYQILTGRHTGMLSTDVVNSNNNMEMAGVMSLGVHADFAVTDKINLHTAVAYAQADVDEFNGVDIDEEYGWEIDLGASYKLMDNLTYSVDFGYLMAGDFFKGYDIVANATTDAEDVYVLNHRLSMEF